MNTLWGIDLGGTKIEGVVLKVPRGHRPNLLRETLEEEVEVLARMRVSTEADQGYEHIVGRVAHLVDRLEAETGMKRPAVIGVGTPGAEVASTGLMKNCNTVCLNGAPLPADLASAMGVEVRTANDADCFALAEATLGAARGHATVFGVIMGTGVGGGIVANGSLVRGPNGLTGESGHTTLVPEGLPCYCGRRGCVETYLSGPAVERGHFERTGESMRLADIAATAECSDPAGGQLAKLCQETIERMCDDFGRALANVVNIFDPEAIVLGGGAGQVSQLRTLGRERLAANVFGSDFETPLLAPHFGDSAGVIGAAVLSVSE